MWSLQSNMIGLYIFSWVGDFVRNHQFNRDLIVMNHVILQFIAWCQYPNHLCRVECLYVYDLFLEEICVFVGWTNRSGEQIENSSSDKYKLAWH